MCTTDLNVYISEGRYKVLYRDTGKTHKNTYIKGGDYLKVKDHNGKWWLRGGWYRQLTPPRDYSIIPRDAVRYCRTHLLYKYDLNDLKFWGEIDFEIID